MNIFLNEEEIKEIPPLEPSEDKGIVINPEVGKRSEGVSDLQKEIVALDTLVVGATEAARINGVPQSSASKYSNGKDVNNELGARIISQKYEIEDRAVAKLMHTLDLLDPSDMEKTKDKIALMNGLGNLISKIGSNSNDGKGGTQVTLNLYAPTQKTENHYNVIEA